MEQEIRKVIFSLIPLSGFTPDETQQAEQDELARKRMGLYRGSTEVIENGLKTLKLVVEDEETGIIHEVDKSLVEFLK